MAETEVAPPVMIRQIPLKHLVESALNPRKTFEGLDELTASIEEHGVLVPLLVRELSGGKYEILAGARRFRAAAKAKLEDLPCRVLEVGLHEGAGAVEVILVENAQRENVHPLEEADVFMELLTRLNGDMDKLSKRLSKPRPFLRQRLALLNMTPEARKLFITKRVTLEGAMQIARLQTPDQKEVVSWFKQQDITTNRLREMIDHHFMLELKGVAWKLNDAELVKKAGACLTCPKRTGTSADLFNDLAKEGDRCTDTVCFNEKAKAYLERRKTEIEKSGEKVTFAYADYVQKGIPGALLHHEWKATKKGACEDTKPLLLLEFKQLGKLVYGCTATNGCKKCGVGTRESAAANDTYQASQKKARAKAKVDKEVRSRLLKGILERSRESQESLLRRVTIAAFDRLWDASRVDLCRFLAETVDKECLPVKAKGYGGWDVEKARVKIQSASSAVLGKISMALAFAPELSHHNTGDDLKAYAKELGLNLKEIEKAVVVEQAKKPAKAAVKKVVGKKPKK